jgi:hypothetical protein
VAVTLVTGLAFGLAPAFEGTRFDVNSMLKTLRRGRAAQAADDSVASWWPAKWRLQWW